METSANYIEWKAQRDTIADFIERSTIDRLNIMWGTDPKSKISCCGNTVGGISNKLLALQEKKSDMPLKYSHCVLCIDLLLCKNN